ncbi:putative AC9 transposase, partial [Bienertia sinuspersici]
MKKPKNYKWQKNDGTGTMSQHLRSEHGLGPEGEEGSSGGGQAQLQRYASDMPGAGMPFIYNTDRMIAEFGKFVIADEFLSSFGESPNYEYSNRVALQPQYRRVPRNTLKRRTQQSYYAYRGYLMETFRTYDGHVSLTSDTWTSTYGEPFVCVTAHWIDDDWLLQKRIICFEAMEEAHNGFNIKSRIVSFCKNFHLVDKLFSISLDNATANTSAMQFLKEDPSIKLVLNGPLMHIRSKIVHDVLETFDNATHIFSYVYEPNIHTVILECIKIICTIKQTSLANPGATVKRLLDNMKVKWCAYFTGFPPIYAIAAILDPGVKLEGLTNLLTFYYQQLDIQFDVPYYVNNCKRIVERLCEDYGDVIQPQLVGSSMGASRLGILGHVLKKSRTDGSGSSSSSSNIGIGEYLTYQFETEENFHIIQWWKNHSSKFLILARIAKDILAIPASTIASESTFSAGRRVLDGKRSRLSSESIEMC